MTNYCFSLLLRLPGYLLAFIHICKYCDDRKMCILCVCVWQANGSKFMNRMNEWMCVCVHLCVTHQIHISSIFHRNSCAFIYERWSRRIWHITLKYQTITCRDDCVIAGFIFERFSYSLSPRKCFRFELALCCFRCTLALFTSFLNPCLWQTWMSLSLSRSYEAITTTCTLCRLFLVQCAVAI